MSCKMDVEGLAIVCASLGSVEADDDDNEVYVKSPDCLESLKDLQRCMRRDNPQSRDVFLQLGKWNTVRQDLIPLIKRYRDDFDLVLNCVKVLVFLTMPVDPSSHQVSLQVEYLQRFKTAVIAGDAIAVIMSQLEEPLQHLERGSVGDDDWKMFQLFLTLLRNLLSIPDSSPHQYGASDLSNLKDQTLERLFTESVMELVVALTQHIEGDGGLRHDNLLILEIVHYVFLGKRADVVANAANVEKQTGRSAMALRTILQAEKEGLKSFRNGHAARHSPFIGTFVQVARDGSKTILTRDPYQSPLENLTRKPQIKRGPTKRIAPEGNPILPTSLHIYVLLRDFADQFLASGYNILMQSVKDDTRRGRAGTETPEVVAFFQVAQFFTAYQYFTTRKDQQRKSDTTLGEGAENEVSVGRVHCGQISSTMDEDMFTMVISKWHEYEDLAKGTKDWGPLAAAGGLMKEMVRMLDHVLKGSGSLTEEGQQEVRTARILIYKVFYDQTEHGILRFLQSLIKSFDIYKQPRSHLADLVEITHIVLRILEDFAKAGESLRVLKKAHRRLKKLKPATTLSGEQSEEAVDKVTAAQAGENSQELDGNCLDGLRVSNDDLFEKQPGDEETPRIGSETSGADTQNQSAVDLKENHAASSPRVEEDEEENFHTSPPGENDEKNFGGEEEKGTKEVDLDILKAVRLFADNTIVRNYCFLLKFFSSNRVTTNYYIVRMLQRICEDCMLEPMLYQISVLHTFYNILSSKEVYEAEGSRYIVAFLSKVIRRLFKKLKTQPLLFVELLFWKTRNECHDITVDYMIHSMGKTLGGSSRGRQRINIADALGDDEDEVVPSMRPDSHDERSAGESDDDSPLRANVKDPPRSNLFSEDQEALIRELFGKFTGSEDVAQLIAMRLDSSGKYTAAEVTAKLIQFGLLRDTTKKSSIRSRLFSVEQDEELKELFNKHGNGKHVSKVIAESMGGHFKISQISRRLRTLGLVKPKPKMGHASLSTNSSDDEDDNVSPVSTDLSHTEGKAGLRKKRLARKTSNRDFDLSGSEDDVPLNRLGISVPRQGKKVARSSMIELTEEENDVSINRSSTVELSDIEDDAPINGLGRPGTGQGRRKAGKRIGRTLERSLIQSINTPDFDDQISNGAASEVPKPKSYLEGHCFDATNTMRRLDKNEMGNQLVSGTQASGLRASFDIAARRNPKKGGHERSASACHPHAVLEPEGDDSPGEVTIGTVRNEEVVASGNARSTIDTGAIGENLGRRIQDNDSAETTRTSSQPLTTTDVGVDDEVFQACVSKRRRVTRILSKTIADDEQEGDVHTRTGLQRSGRRLAGKMSGFIAGTLCEEESLNDF